MNLQSLVYCSDNRDTRIVRRVLSDLGIEVDHCDDTDSAIHKLTRQQFSAVIVDLENAGAPQILSSLRHTPRNKHAVTIALLDPMSTTHAAADLVVEKPLSLDHGTSSFRAARTVMKREQVRNARVPVELPVTFITGRRDYEAQTSDLGEGGMALQIPLQARSSGDMKIRFQLPGTDHSVDCFAATAWDGTGGDSGIRFVDISAKDRERIRSWVARYTSGLEPDDPPETGKLSDVTPFRCSLKMSAQFPLRTIVSLVQELEGRTARIEGVVRVVDRSQGMQIEFYRNTEEQRIGIEAFIKAGSASAVQVQPVGIEHAA